VRYNSYGAISLGGSVLPPEDPDFYENYFEYRGAVSRHVLFDSCVWYDQYSETWGNNNAAVRHDYVEDWTIRNCAIIKANETKDGLPFPDRTQAFHGYSQRRLLIENCTVALVGTPLSTKAHWKLLDGTPLTDEVEARYNFAYGIAASAGTYVGSKNARSGEQYYHHNIFARSAPSPTYAGAAYTNSIDAYPSVSGLVRFEHNSFIDISGVAGTDSSMVVINADTVSLYGNILGVATQSIGCVDYAKVGTPAGGGLMASDYNVFDTPRFVMDRANDPKTWASLAAWQAATSADASTLHVDNPDQNSVVGTQSVNYVSIPEYDCRLRAGSPAIGLLPDGTDAGAYQTGTEVIGARLPWIDLTQFWPECPAWLNPGLQTRGSA
jgi:hypothetical protein